MNRLLTLLFALGLFAVPTFGQTADGPSNTASVEYTFRFVVVDMFYIPWNGNGEELDRLIDCIAENRSAILDGSAPVEVKGHCTLQPSTKENLAVAKTRSNRMKTEMILRDGLTEACFTTQNHASDSNLVTVRIVIPAGPSEAEQETQHRAAEQEREARLAVAWPEAEREAREPVVRAAGSRRLLQSATGTADNTDCHSVGNQNPNRISFVPACQPAALGNAHARPRCRVAHLRTLEPQLQRFVDLVVVERQEPPLCPLGSCSGSALLHG